MPNPFICVTTLLAGSRHLRPMRIAAGVASLALLPGIAWAQRPAPRSGPFSQRLVPTSPAIGIRGGYDFDAEAWSVGGQARLPFARRLEFIPSADAFFGSDRTDWQLNADVALRLGRRGGLYGGAGLAAERSESVPGEGADTNVGTNLFLGLQLPGLRLPVRPFAEARWTLADGRSPFRLVAGVNLPR